MYCDKLIEVGRKFLNDVEQRINKYAHCAVRQSPSKQDNEIYRRPSQLVSSITKWYKNFVSIKNIRHSSVEH